MRLKQALTGLVLSAPALTWAGRPDYSHLSNSEMEVVVWQISVGLLVMALLGLFGFWRYWRRYEPGPGKFSPLQVLLSVGAVLMLVSVGAWLLLGGLPA